MVAQPITLAFSAIRMENLGKIKDTQIDIRFRREKYGCPKRATQIDIGRELWVSQTRASQTRAAGADRMGVQ